MRRTTPRRLVLLLALTSVALATTATALADTVVNQKIPFSGTSFNDCTDELVVVEGMLHTTNRFSTSGGRVHSGVHMQSAGVKGTAFPSGARYIEKNVENQQTNFSIDGAPAEFTNVRSYHLTRLGEDGSFVDGDDFQLHSIIHMTVNANGILTADKTEMTMDCR